MGNPTFTEPLLPAPLLLVEDEQSMQIRLRAILTSLGYAEDELFAANNAAQARRLYEDRPFSMALVDIRLPDGSGLDLIADWHEDDPALPILVISAWSAGPAIVSAIQAGASGYLLKERDDGEIAAGIRGVLRGGAPIDPFVARHILAIVAPPSALAAQRPRGQLSPREIEILELVNQGMTNKEIARALSLSNLTVSCTTKSIYKKLAVHSRSQAVYAARSRGLLS
jgi:DNA-binding NarL/FixJ family response regulator